MSTFQIVQMDPDAAKWLGFAKQQCKRIMDNGTKDFYREWPLGDATVKAKSYGGTVKLWLVAGGVTDFVGVAMPNPVPYRGVSIGVVTPSIVYPYAHPSAPFNTGPDAGAVINNPDGSQTFIFTNCTYVYIYSYFGEAPANPPSAYSVWTGSLLNHVFTGAWTDLMAQAGGIKTYVMTSDGTVLASEIQNTSGGHTYYVPDTTWNGDAYCNMYVDSVTPPINHQLTFTVPEDCIYPVPATPPDVFKSSRKAWFLKNSTEFIAAIKGGFQPGAAGVTRAELQTRSIPASWDYQIKHSVIQDRFSFLLQDGSVAGYHTKMPIIMSITSAADVVVSDTSANLTQAGTKVTRRTTTFQYTDANGANQTATIDGTLTQVVTQHTLNGSNIATSRKDTYLNWYEPSYTPFNTSQNFLFDQFARDDHGYGLAPLWSGDEQQGYSADSSFGYAPGTPLTYANYAPAYPKYTSTLKSTSAALFVQYHNTVIPQYVADTAQSSTVMNNSYMYHVKQVKLRLFGPAPGGTAIGIFPDPTDADGATQIAYYGEATLSFDWTTGSITISKWSPKQDANGNDAPEIIALPTGYSYKNVSGTLYFNDGRSNYTQAYNCAIGYVWGSSGMMWLDVAEYWKVKSTFLTLGAFDQVLYTVMQGKQITQSP